MNRTLAQVAPSSSYSGTSVIIRPYRKWSAGKFVRGSASGSMPRKLHTPQGVVRYAATKSPVVPIASAIVPFKWGMGLLGLGLMLAALTLIIDMTFLPIVAGGCLFVGSIVAADAVERIRREQ